MRWIARIFLAFCLAIAGYDCLRFTRRFTVLRVGLSMRMSMYVAGLVMFAMVVAGWLLIWRGLVPWTPARKIGTSIVALLAQPVGFVLGVILSRGDMDFGWFLSAVLPTGVFVLGSSAFWIKIPWNPGSRAPEPGKVPCPKCGYNLRGLREARCPECGGEFTLEQLVAPRAG